uniref:Uncharacterized protein n=1 Tax=Solibacter usitatus (strain Ellin6076) TaxID=234267 RepID=Q020I6_SOLUE
MILEVAIVAVLLTIGNVAFWHFDPYLPLWRRVVKVLAALGITAVVSHYFGRPGVLVALAAMLLPVIYIHAIWLPRHGVNGWTGEPREKYYALRGWTHPKT